jgi:hypothetical protein
MGPSQQGVPATLVCTQAQKGRTTVRVVRGARDGAEQKFSAVGASTSNLEKSSNCEFQKKFDCLNEADIV